MRVNNANIGYLAAEDLGVMDNPIKCNSCKNCAECNLKMLAEGKKSAVLQAAMKDNLSYDDKTNRWTASYLYTEPVELLAPNGNNNYSQAVACAITREKRLDKTGLRSDANTAFAAQVEKGAVKLVPTPDRYDGVIHYIPLTESIKESSTTTPLRLCGNSSMTRNGISLNNIQPEPLSINNDLYNVLIRWRAKPVAFIGDISKFYNCILSCERDRHLRRVLWRNSNDEEFKQYTMETLSFGDVAAGSFATLALRLTADMKKDDFPAAVEALYHSTYLDDLLDGEENDAVSRQLFADIESVAAVGGFHFKPAVFSGDDAEPQLVLGMVWLPKHDKLQLTGTVNFTKKIRGRRIGASIDPGDPMAWPDKLTKRETWQLVGSLYDPLGLCSPYWLNVKILQHKLCYEVKDWDAQIPQHFYDQLKNVMSKLHIVHSKQFDRAVLKSGACTRQLVTFTDASQEAYAAVLYLRSTYLDGNVHVQLLTAKTRVAAKKFISIPKMELQAAQLGARLANRVKTALPVTIDQMFFFTDSSSVLGMIKADYSMLNSTYGYRVAEINNHTRSDDWFHLAGTENISDFCTRSGVTADDFVNNEIWTSGPKFLRNDIATWPGKNTFKKVPLDALNRTAKALIKVNLVCARPVDDCFEEDLSAPADFDHGSVAHADNDFLQDEILPEPQHTAPTAALEDDNTMLSILERHLQRFPFDRAFKVFCLICDFICKRLKRKLLPRHDLKLFYFSFFQKQKVDASTKKNLNMKKCETSFLNIKKNVWMACGRSGWLPTEIQGVPYLPFNQSLLYRLVEHTHCRHHDGADATLQRLRLDCWTPRIRPFVRRFVKNCSICARYRAHPVPQILGDVVKPMTPAFFNVCCDMAGPFTVTDKKTKEKRWVLVVACLSTGALHTELTRDSGTEALANAFNRFVSKRGLPQTCHSDNATTFHKLIGYIAAVKRQKIEPPPGVKLIEWNFSAVKAPHQNGAAERMVGSLKTSLSKVCKSRNLTEDEFSLALAIATSAVNSRPLAAKVTDDSLIAITPNQLLMSRSHPSEVKHNMDNATCPLDRMTYVDKLVASWWKSWTKTVWPSYFHLPKWQTQVDNLKPGDVVLFDRHLYQPGIWRLGRVTDVVVNARGIVRNVTIAYRISGEEKNRTTTRHSGQVVKLNVADQKLEQE